ncbi:putative ribonuclease H-like domain-containing protein, partial [Tanacetum coccineum]
MQEELLQFKLQKVWILVDLPKGKRAIDTKWIFRNKKDERGIVTRNKARLAIRLFLAYALFMGFMVYQMDVKSAFLYGTIEEEVYVCQPPGFEDLTILIKVYNDEFYGRTQFLLRCQSASTLMDTEKPLLKDSDGDDVDVHLYRSMIGSLMYLTSSRTRTLCLWYVHVPDLSYTKVSHSHAVKRIFRYLKGQPKLGLWYPRNSPFDLVAYSDSDYAGASLDRKNKTTGGCSVPMLRASTLVSESKLGNGYNFMHTMFNIDNNSTICMLFNNVTTAGPEVVVSTAKGKRENVVKSSAYWIGRPIGKWMLLHMTENKSCLTDYQDINGGFVAFAGSPKGYETVYKEWEDRMERAATTASSLEAEQDSGNINKTQSMATLNESFPQGTDSGSGPRIRVDTARHKLNTASI